ncbi:MAG: UDP-N-acetylmuramoyl-L-alanyl-D-glutamate--2,6-diaminopimelate ligase, partial [Gammaproteobacteria bacterium]|nr:UDP-N-acetylmuramoyl-L-alanyl-D-glutamate--2,6-diaminopimelate ligase [Gammaproteobacteria bacterium]
VIVTDDNPRTEDPDLIIREVLHGMECPEQAAVVRNRQEAIALGINNSTSGDVVLVAGKGHEEYQITGTERLAYSDRKTVSTFLENVTA